MTPAARTAFNAWLGVDNPDMDLLDVYGPVFEAAFSAGRAAGLREALEAGREACGQCHGTGHVEWFDVKTECGQCQGTRELDIDAWRERIAALLETP